MTVRPLWADVPSSVQPTGTWRTFRPVDRPLEVHEVQRLLEVLPRRGVHFDGEGFPVIDYDYCKGCGICEVECAPRAIIMEKEGP